MHDDRRGPARGGMIVRIAFLFIALSPQAFAQNWVRATDIPQEYVDAFASHQGSLYAATDSVVYASTDGGASWAPVPSRPPTIYIQALFSHGGSLYLASLGDGVFRTDDGGATWQAVNGGLAGSSKIVVALAARGDTLYAGTGGNGVYVLGHGAPPSWSAFNQGLFQFGTNALVASGTSLVAGIGSYVFHRAQGAAAWTDAVIDSLGMRTPISLHVHGSNVFLGTSGGVFLGDSTGTDWVKADITQFADADIVEFASYGPRCYAGLAYNGQHWIFSTDDLGDSWQVRAHEFADLLVLDVAGTTLWAGRTDGLWSIDIGPSTDAGDPALPSSFSLDQNYPNPFNPSTTFSFSLPSRTKATLTIFDALGREVATPLDRVMEAGRHELRWDAEGIPSGAYLVRLRAGSFAGTKKILLVR